MFFSHPRLGEEVFLIISREMVDLVSVGRRNEKNDKYERADLTLRIGGMEIAGALAAFKKRAYLLIEVEPGHEANIIPELEKMENMTNVDFVHGEYDVVCVLEGKYEDMDKTIVEVRKLPHIRKTTTLTAFDTHLE